MEKARSLDPDAPVPVSSSAHRKRLAADRLERQSEASKVEKEREKERWMERQRESEKRVQEMAAGSNGPIIPNGPPVSPGASDGGADGRSHRRSGEEGRLTLSRHPLTPMEEVPTREEEG